MEMNKTVAAISTPFGRGGIAVIRISGDEAIEIASKVFVCRAGKPFSESRPRTARYGDIYSRGKRIDTGMATLFRAPDSFTGEDTVEICCHGGILVTQTTLESVFEAGAYPAGPGEFTRRSFLAGKTDLSGAEAVGAIIDAKSRDALLMASSHYSGKLASEIEEIRKAILSLLSSFYVRCDYPDEDLSELSDDEIKRQIENIASRLRALVSSYRAGHAIAEGISCAIVGRTNSGKSSLLNALLGSERAIVSDEEGTTRDTIEETASCGKVTVRFCDTAGLREGAGKVESIGIAKSREKLDSCELVLAVFDSSEALIEADRELINEIKEKGKCAIAVLNKCDLSPNIDEDEFSSFARTVKISALRNEGIDELKAAIESLFAEGEIDYDTSAIVANARQNASLTSALEKVRCAYESMECGYSADVACIELEAALTAIGCCDGRTVGEEIVAEIFSHFCVGK